MNKQQNKIIGGAILLVIIVSAILSFSDVITGKFADTIIMFSSIIVIALYFILKKYKTK